MIGPLPSIDLRAAPSFRVDRPRSCRAVNRRRVRAEARGRPYGPGLSPGPTRRSRSLRSACLPVLPQEFALTHHDSHPLPPSRTLEPRHARTLRARQLT